VIKLLIVEDEQATREGLMSFVPWQELGVDQVMDASDGLQALQICTHFKPDIVLTDVKMPHMDGIQLAMKLRTSFPKCKILFLSSYADKAYLKSAIQLHALDYLEKPVNLDELQEHIRNAVMACIDEQNQRLKDSDRDLMLIESLPLLKEKFALTLISKPMEAEEALTQLVSLGKPIFEHASFVTALIKLQELTDVSLELVQSSKITLLEKVEAIFAADGLQCCCGFKDMQHMILHIYSDNLRTASQLIQPLSSVQSELQSLLDEPLRTFNGVGGIVDRPSKVMESYQTAAVATQRQFYLGYNQIVVYEELDHPSLLQLDEGELDIFSNSIEAENKDHILAFIHVKAQQLRTSGDTLVNDTKNFFFNLLLRLFQAADKKNVELAEEQRGKDYLWSVIFRFNTLFEVERYTLDKINYFFEQLHHKELGGSIAFHIQKYVLKNLAEPELSIKSIADSLYLTPNYLSLQFKKESGTTINQYITETRIERAKELLKDRKHKLYEVATIVGFHDANYFAKTFKKAIGMTPSEFREKYA
jgi:two-component system response regulator YesN